MAVHPFISSGRSLKLRCSAGLAVHSVRSRVFGMIFHVKGNLPMFGTATPNFQAGSYTIHIRTILISPLEHELPIGSITVVYILIHSSDGIQKARLFSSGKDFP